MRLQVQTDNSLLSGGAFMNLGFMNMARSALMLHARSSTQQARNPGIGSSHSLAPSPPAPTQTRSLTHSCACSLRGQPRNVTIKRNRAASTANRTAAHRSPNVDEATLPHSAMLAREKGRTFFREVPLSARSSACSRSRPRFRSRARARARRSGSLLHTHTRTHQAKWQEAAEAFGEAIRECDSSHTLYTNRALCYQKLQRWPEVEQVLSAMCVYVYVCVCMCVYTCI